MSRKWTLQADEKCRHRGWIVTTTAQLIMVRYHAGK